MTTVRYFHNGLTGAPSIAGQAGKMIEVLDACLVNGFGTGTVDSVVIYCGIATVTRAAGNPFEVDVIANISGATVTGGSINGDKRVLTRTATTYTFSAAGIPDQTATGTITHKVAPLGWSKAFSGTNLAAYRITDVAGTGFYLRVDDTSAQVAQVTGYEAMSDINTGTGAFGGWWWGKSATADSTARTWTVVGDSRFFIFAGAMLSASAQSTGCFGDFISRKSPDAYACMLQAVTLSNPHSFNQRAEALAYCTYNAIGTAFARGYSGIGSNFQSIHRQSGPSSGTGISISATATYAPVYPNPADNSLLTQDILLVESPVPCCVRGLIPGVKFIYHSNNSGMSNLSKIDGSGSLAGRKLMFLSDYLSASIAVDITGPWR